MPAADRGNQCSGIPRLSDRIGEHSNVGKSQAAVEPAGDVASLEVRRVRGGATVAGACTAFIEDQRLNVFRESIIKIIPIK